MHKQKGTIAKKKQPAKKKLINRKPNKKKPDLKNKRRLLKQLYWSRQQRHRRSNLMFPS